MSSRPIPEAARPAYVALYKRLRQGAQGWFLWDGLMFMGVPKEAVGAYCVARYWGQDKARACIVAWLGEESVRRFEGDPDWAGWMVGRAWAGQMAKIEAASAFSAEVAA
jgi:hypothetical protein